MMYINTKNNKTARAVSSETPMILKDHRMPITSNWVILYMKQTVNCNNFRYIIQDRNWLATEKWINTTNKGLRLFIFVRWHFLYSLAKEIKKPREQCKKFQDTKLRLMKLINNKILQDVHLLEDHLANQHYSCLQPILSAHKSL